MSPKKTILFYSGILGAIGFVVSIVMITIGGGFSGQGPSILNPPSAKDLWLTGNYITDGLELNYSLTSFLNQIPLDLSLSVKFIDGSDWLTKFEIHNQSKVIDFVANLSKQNLALKGINQKDKNLFKLIDNSIFSIKELVREPKYLVPGAVWDSIFVGATKIDVKITNREKLQTPAGVFDTFILSYKINGITSKFYVNKDLPLPVKAYVFNSDGNQLYGYILNGMFK